MSYYKGQCVTICAVAISGICATHAAGQALSEDHKLIASDGQSGDGFGQSVAYADGIIAVGAYKDDDFGNNSGSAYLFDADTGAQLFKLLPNDGAPNDLFGESIALGSGVVAVGAIKHNQSGAVYVFDTSTGVQIAKLVSDDIDDNDDFGISVAIDNNIVAVGARFDDDSGVSSGGAYLFDALTGTQLLKLTPEDVRPGVQFGHSIAIDDGIVAVGAIMDYENGNNSGSVYLFDANTGVLLNKLLATDGATGDVFGYSVAIDENVVAVGARADDPNGTQSSSAYLFNAFTGEQIIQILPDVGGVDDWFGYSIDIHRGLVAVGAERGSSVSNLPTAYIFEATTGTQVAELIPSDLGMNQYFGRCLSLDDDTIAFGALGGTVNGVSTGSAYLFELPDQLRCHANLNGDAALNFFDISAFLVAFSEEDPLADFVEDGAFNFLDVSAFLAEFAAGCP
ncbi:MAG: FG-GAP repeat protein [Phycisphaerales bacterium]|nr:FG-GAP repeat protein [Phycisphaerales bacterium]